MRSATSAMCTAVAAASQSKCGRFLRHFRMLETRKMFETLTLEFSGQLATLTLNRPDKRNAINSKMVSEIQSALDEIENSRTRVALVTGAGKSFCAGMDLEMLSDIASQSSAENMDDSR